MLHENDGATPLLIASRQGHSNVVETLLNAGAVPHISMSDGTTPLAIARQNGHQEVVELLVNIEKNVQHYDEAKPLLSRLLHKLKK